jgi:ubiquinone/menaquinone biosynthesis C-methylase UbiE
VSHSISRVKRTKAEAQAAYDRMSRWYDLLAAPSERRYRQAGLDILDAQEGERILEIGSGTGHALVALARTVGSMESVCGLDISMGMLDFARERVEEADLSERVSLWCGDGAAIPFKDNCFEAIFISFTLELFDTPEIPVVLRECWRVLRDEGRLAVVSMVKKEGMMVQFYEWVHRLLPAYVDCRPIFVRRSLEEAGFQIIEEQELSMWGLPVAVVLAKDVPPRLLASYRS